MHRSTSRLRVAGIATFLVAATFGVYVPSAKADNAEATTEHAKLVKTIADLDTALFASFNDCASPGQLEKHAAFLDPNLEFYHDNGGVSWTSKDYLATTKKNVCGHFKRLLVPGTMEVYPIAGFGALEQGHHYFCPLNVGARPARDPQAATCFGKAQFLIIWHQTPDGWKATRIFSYGHEPMN